MSNKGKWNNCFSKFSNRVLPPIFISTILQSVRKENWAHYFPYDVKLGLLAHSRSFLANQKARNAIVGAENLLNNNILCFHMTSCIFQNVKSQSPWVFSFLWLLTIMNTFRFEGFQFDSNLRFYNGAFWNSLFSRHRTSRWPTECVTHSVIFSNLNCSGIAKSVYVDIF